MIPGLGDVDGLRCRSAAGDRWVGSGGGSSRASMVIDCSLSSGCSRISMVIDCSLSSIDILLLLLIGSVPGAESGSEVSSEGAGGFVVILEMAKNQINNVLKTQMESLLD